jgi:predicted NACHT family NTPase
MDIGMRRQLNPFREPDTTVGAPQHDGRKLPPKDLLSNKTKVIITGIPGCGKTTLLKYLALEALENQRLLPIWVELKALDKNLFKQAESIAAKTGNLILAEL